MERQRVVHLVADPARLEVREQRLAAFGPDGVLVEDVLVGRIDRRRGHAGQAGERLGVLRGDFAPAGAPRGQVRQLGEQHRRLDRVEPAVEADLVVVVLAGAAVQPLAAEAVGQRVILRHHHAAVAPGPEVLRGEEREGPDRAELAGGAPLPVHLAPGPDRLGGILDQHQVVLLGERHQRRHVRHLPEEVNDDYGAGTGRDGCRNGLRVGVEGAGLDVHEHRAPARVVDGSRCGEKGEGRGDDLVARLQAEGAEREEQRVGPAGAGNAVLGARQPGHLALELAHLRPHDEALPFDDAHDGGQDGVLDPLVLGDEIEQRDVHWANPRNAVGVRADRWNDWVPAAGATAPVTRNPR